MSHEVELKEVVKRFGEFKAVNNLSITVRDGELFTLLGPSGCGKTTLLRMIAGFNQVDAGEIWFGERLINKLPAHQRNSGMVFQNYAIFPHLSVYENVAYGLKARKIKSKEIKNRVDEALELVQMEDFSGRQPSQLSGGQQQRIALARAVVIQPDVLLMDEPLSNLDAKLRVQMRSVIKKLQKRLNITTIYVTHDQEEALAISDRIAIMRNGSIEQVGNPIEIYQRPRNLFVAGFIGTSNFISGQLVARLNNLAEVMVLGKKKLQLQASPELQGEVILAVRPEAITIQPPQAGELSGQISLITFLGDYINYELKLADGPVIEVNEYTKDLKQLRAVGDEVAVIIEPSQVLVYQNSLMAEDLV